MLNLYSLFPYHIHDRSNFDVWAIIYHVSIKREVLWDSLTKREYTYIWFTSYIYSLIYEVNQVCLYLTIPLYFHIENSDYMVYICINNLIKFFN